MTHARFLIIGASGYIGSRLLNALGGEQAIGTYHRSAFPGGVHFNPLTTSLSETILPAAPRLTHAFLFHAMSGIDECARQPDRAYAINVESQKRVIDELVAANIVPVFASSDAVFDGSRGAWTETDQVNPILTYGRHKAEIETHLSRNAPRAVVARLPKVVAEEASRSNLISAWLDQHDAGQTIRCAYDQTFSPVDINDVVAALVRLAKEGLRGVFHVCGPRAMTRLELLHILTAEVIKYCANAPLIVPCSIRDFEFAEARPLDCSMSPRKVYHALGANFSDMEEICKRAAERRYGATARQTDHAMNVTKAKSD